MLTENPKGVHANALGLRAAYRSVVYFTQLMCIIFCLVSTGTSVDDMYDAFGELFIVCSWCNPILIFSSASYARCIPQGECVTVDLAC